MYFEVLRLIIPGWLTDLKTSFFNHNRETYNTVIRLFTDEGTPKSYANLNYFSVNTYTFTKVCTALSCPLSSAKRIVNLERRRKLVPFRPHQDNT